MMRNKRLLPEYLLERHQLTGTLTFAILFSVIYLNLYVPFSDTAWFRLGNSVFFLFTAGFIAISIIFLTTSRVIMYKTRKLFSMTVLQYVLWCIAEVIVICLFYTFVTADIVRPEGVTPAVAFIKSLFSASIALLVPYMMSAMYFIISEKERYLSFSDERLQFDESHLENNDVIGDAYMFLIEKFASDAGKKAGEFFTPKEVSTLLARLTKSAPGSRICDPTCGSGSLLIKAGREVGSDNFSLYGQELNGSTWALAMMNMLLHGFDSATIRWGDTLRNPKLKEGDALMKFDTVVANPPFSLEKWGADEAADDPYNRFWRGIPPKSKGDWAFICHMLEVANEHGKVGVVVPHGVLFRGASEGKIRQQTVEENLVEAIIGLPANLFYGTGIPAAIAIFNKAKTQPGHTLAFFPILMSPIKTAFLLT